MSPATTLPAAAPARSWYKWELIIVLFMAFFLHQGDRQIYGPVIPLIKQDLGATDVQMGMVATVFTLLYGVFVPLAGCLGDFLSKKWIVGLSLLTFSIGTLLTGLSNSIAMLIVFRGVATGIGEAFYYPAANSLIGQYHAQTRASAMAIHQTALYVGIVASSWIAPFVGARYGWKFSFLTFGSVGVFVAMLVALRLRDERRDPVPAAVGQSDAPPRLGEVVRAVVSKPTLYFLSVAFAGMVFVNVGFLTWMPTFLHEKFKLPLATAGLHSVLFHYLFAFVGVMSGGWISDRLARRRPTIRMEVEVLGLLLGAPFIYLMGAATELSMVFVALAGFGLFRGLYDSNLFAALFDVIPPKYRSSATGLMLSFAFTMGATSPLLLGYLKQHIGLSVGLSWLGAVYVFGATVIFIALKTCFARDYVREEAAVPQRGFEPVMNVKPIDPQR